MGGLRLLSPAKDCCQLCAVRHAPGDPHNAQSLYYAMRFLMQHGRDGTWADAIAHCAPEMQMLWRQALEARDAWSEPPEGVEPIAEPIDD